MGLAFSMAVINILDSNYQTQTLDVPKMITKKKETVKQALVCSAFLPKLYGRCKGCHCLTFE